MRVETNPNARRILGKRHSKAREQARDRVTRVREECEMMLAAKMARMGFLR
jgi:hypothetical protein